MTTNEATSTRTTRLRVVSTALAICLCGLATASGASATPPTGTPPPSNTTPVVGTLEGGRKAKQDGIALKVRRDTTVRTFTLTYPIGSSSGWHAHPGIVLAVVQQGTVIRRVGCDKEVFTEGESFTEAAPHRVSNFYRHPDDPGAVEAILSITQLYPKNAPAARIEKDPPRCS